ncbi:MAG: hypothetical protein O3C40_12275 [Planctomycetota bacterium]|nr:hypothetical protein [Planctomycetota bacterium]
MTRCAGISGTLGKESSREAIAKSGNLISQGNTINRIRIVFKYGDDFWLLD